METRVRLFNVAEYYRMDTAGVFRDDERVELIEGRIIEMCPRETAHIWAVSDLIKMFAQRDDIFVASFSPLRLNDRTEPVTDITLLDRDAPQNRHPSPGHTQLVVEVADVSLDYGRSVKAQLYARAGIPEYWIVDLNGERMEVYREPSTDGCRTVRYVLRGESVAPAFAPEMSIQVDDILGPIPEAED